MPNLDRQDYVILNSTANVQKAIDALGQYERIHWNDYLCGRKQEQKNGQKLLLRQKKGRGI